MTRACAAGCATPCNVRIDALDSCATLAIVKANRPWPVAQRESPLPSTLTFDEAIEASSKDLPRSILLGNGFSMAQTGSQFSYRNLLECSGLPEDGPVLNVFRAINTVDFEEVMFALEHAAIIEEAYGDVSRSQQFQSDADAVREALIHAIRAVHPDIRFDIPNDQLNSCTKFLKNFESIFTLNYDLLLYWVILKTRIHTDGLGLGDAVSGFKTLQVDAYCSTYYLHGALHLFLSQTGETKKRLLTSTTLVGDIARTIRVEKQLPIFVAEGTMGQKIKRINSIPYLRLCYDELRKRSGSIFIFGHSLGDNDIHIYDAIFGSKIEKLFFAFETQVRIGRKLGRSWLGSPRGGKILRFSTSMPRALVFGDERWRCRPPTPTR
jgi:hypothetical protein